MLTLNPNAYSLLIRPLLFRLPPETAQSAADLVLRQRFIWRALSPALRVRSSQGPVNLGGLKLENPVGLAAGYDKNCEFLPSMAALGFGYVTGGTVMESPRPGNPRPRLLRYTQEQSLINSLGFPSKGLEFAARQLEKAQGAMGGSPVVASVSGVTVEEIVRCHRRLEPLADAIEVNISSPNTAGLRVFQEPVALVELIGHLNDGRKKPLFVKLPPYPSPDVSSSTSMGRGTEAVNTTAGETRDRVLGLAEACVQQGVSALTVANSWPRQDTRLAVGTGGISGKLIFPDTLRMVAEIKAQVGDRVAINACGGIFSGEDAWRALRAGATTVQLLTGLIYRGPGVARHINRELLRLMDGESPESLPPE